MMINIGLSPEPVQGGNIASLSGQKEAAKGHKQAKAAFLYSREPNKHKHEPNRHSRVACFVLPLHNV